MTTTSLVSIAFATLAGIAACNSASADVNPERTAACADRTTNVSCDKCCNTVANGSIVDKVCKCKGAATPEKK